MEGFFNYNAIIDLVGVFIVLVIVIWGPKFKKNSAYSRLFSSMIVSILIVLLTDIPAWLLDGAVFPGVHIVLWVLDSLYYAAQTVFCYFWILFSIYWNFPDDRTLKRTAAPLAIPMLLELLLVFSNPWTGWVFTISAENVYARGSMFFSTFILFAFYVVGAVVVTVVALARSRDEEVKRQGQLLLLFMLLPVLATIIQYFYYGISFLWPCTALLLMMIYLNSQQQLVSEKRLRITTMENELMQSRIAIMLSQIQPHFLYNALTAIRNLCRTDPDAAVDAITSFSEFLRGNMDSLTSAEPIPFDRELNHLRSYLNIEKLRFEERLNVVYDLDRTDFLIPALSVQPLAENAVRYGVTKRRSGGTVTISVRSTPETVTVTVADDGVGFDPEAVPTDGKTHIGIANVRERLHTMVGGDLIIHSSSETGTLAEIILPQKRRPEL